MANSMAAKTPVRASHEPHNPSQLLNGEEEVGSRLTPTNGDAHPTGGSKVAQPTQYLF